MVEGLMFGAGVVTGAVDNNPCGRKNKLETWLAGKQNLVRDVLRVVKARCESEHAKMEYQPRLQ